MQIYQDLIPQEIEVTTNVVVKDFHPLIFSPGIH